MPRLGRSALRFFNFDLTLFIDRTPHHLQNSTYEMAAEGTRRSTRVRKAVKSYAVEQAGENEIALSAPPAKRRKKAVAAVDHSDHESETNGMVLTSEVSEIEVVRDVDKDGKQKDKAEKGMKQGGKKRKAAELSSEAATTDIANSSTDFEAVDVIKNNSKPTAKTTTTAKRGKKAKGPPPLDEQVRQKPHSKIYPVAANARAEFAGKAANWHADAAALRIERTKSRIPMLMPGEQETRLRPSVSEPTEQSERFLESANTQRMFILERERSLEEGCHAGHDDCPCEVLKIAGSKGNVYTVTISHLPSCTCPVTIYTRNGEEKCCKHILYVLNHVLKAPHSLEYQNAFLTSELRTLFAQAPPLPTEVAEEELSGGNRKPLSDDCPICFTEFEGETGAVWCKAACGNNIHQDCFAEWAKVRPGNVTCPFCRTLWEKKTSGQKHKISDITMPIERGAGGYVNVRNLLAYD